MKKILLLIAFLFIFQIQTFATTDWTNASNVNKINMVGENLLIKNNLPTGIVFKVNTLDEVNAYANAENEIHVYTGLLKVVENESELAGVIAHEIGHIINSHILKQSLASMATSAVLNVANNMPINNAVKTSASVANTLGMAKLSRKEEQEADITGVDLMIKAGYNPLAMVSFLYKISGNYTDILSDHPSGDKRTMYLYDYLAYTYPDKIKGDYPTQSYREFMAYAQPIIEKRNSSPRKLASFNKKQEKLKKQRMKKLAKYQK